MATILGERPGDDQVSREQSTGESYRGKNPRILGLNSPKSAWVKGQIARLADSVKRDFRIDLQLLGCKITTWLLLYLRTTSGLSFYSPASCKAILMSETSTGESYTEERVADFGVEFTKSALVNGQIARLPDSVKVGKSAG